MTSLALIISLLNALLPGAITLIGDIRSIFKKYPGLTPEQFAALAKEIAGTADATYDQVIAEILADQAANPPTVKQK